MPIKSNLISIINNSHKSVWAEYKSVKRQAIRLGLDPAKVAKWQGPGEPALTYGVMSFWPLQQLAELIGNNASPLSLAGTPFLTFSFLHQKPKVKYKKSPRSKDVEIELGDLLVIRHHFVFKDPNPQGRAFIIQAKANTLPNTGNLTSKEEKQLTLYKNWGLGFSFSESGFGSPGNSALWKFSGGNQGPVKNTGLYGVVLSAEQSNPANFIGDFKDQCAWGIGFPDKAVKNGGDKFTVDASQMSLAEALNKLIFGGFGRTWVTNPNDPDDHWSEFINMILRSGEMFDSYASLQRIGRTVPRMQQIAAFASNIPGLGLLANDRNVLFPYPGASETENWLNQISQWMDSLPPTGEVPKPVETKNNRGGMPFVYIATFGEEPLSVMADTETRGA